VVDLVDEMNGYKGREETESKATTEILRFAQDDTSERLKLTTPQKSLTLQEDDDDLEKSMGTSRVK